MDTREHSYNTRSSKTGRQVYFKNCDNCNNQLPISAKIIKHISDMSQLNIQYHVFCDKCKGQTGINASDFINNRSKVTPVDTNVSSYHTKKSRKNTLETLPKRTRIISNASGKDRPHIVVNSIDDTSCIDDTSNIDHIDMKSAAPEKQLLNILVDIANNNLSEINSDNASEFDEEPFEDLHKDIHYTVEERNYVQNLDPVSQKKLIDIENTLYGVLKSGTPLRFKILNSDMSNRSKSNLLSKIDHYYTLDPSDNEYQKLSPWIDQLDKIPFGKYVPNKVTSDASFSEIQTYLSDTKKLMDDAVYGHAVAKTQIISAIAREISNPSARGNCFAIQGPMGNGKTTLIKEGVCKAMGRPFGFIQLGGMQDSSYLLGHEITYEGSKCGRIIEILGETDCMNPVIFFDELDKLSDTPKGEEISNLLCHLTDSAQNKEFHDKYFSGIDFDMSRATFIFSYNDESSINPILLDRMHRIKTSGFDKSDKTNIAKDYLIPSLLREFSLQESDVTFEQDAIHYIIDNHCNNEKGVRNLRRNIETIIAKLNVMKYLLPEKVNTDTSSPIITELLTKLVEDVVKDNDIVNKDDDCNTSSETCENKDEPDSIEDKTSINVKDIVNYEIKNFKLPYNVTCSDLSFFIDKSSKNSSYEHMYM